MKIAPRLQAFLTALPHAQDEDFVSAPGLGTFKAKHVRRGMERGVLVVHSSGLGLAIMQPSSHGVCAHCSGRKRDVCDHCACLMCSWFRQTEERSSPRVSQEKMSQLARRLQAFQLGGGPVAISEPALDDDI